MRPVDEHVGETGRSPPPSSSRLAFASRLARLEITLQQRFDREEGICGLFAFLCCAAPRYTMFVHKFRSDHRQILTAIRDMRRTASLGSHQQLHADHCALQALIREHEQLENEALVDALEG